LLAADGGAAAGAARRDGEVGGFAVVVRGGRCSLTERLREAVDDDKVISSRATSYPGDTTRTT
jgi:hypothetical protein